MTAMDMDNSRILVKTSKGVEEVKHRTFGLSLAQRSLLIMADGMTSIANMLTRTAQLPKAEENLSWLMSEGFVESVMPSQHHPASAGAAAAAASGVSHKQALIAISRELLGADAPKILQRLEDVSDNPSELLAAVERCHKFIKLTIDENKAAQFLQAGRALFEPR